jgi:ABC-type Mn2+/Zn2+ transport system ATPase subunit
MGRPKLLELEEVVLEDLIDIQLNVGSEDVPRFVDIDNLSSGQRCTAVLNLLMLENTDPLIVDQPEDNLDNAFIANNIVGELRKQKENRQFVFSTHNANIPVFGDAEWIGVMTIEDSVSILPDDSVGSIDKDTLRPKVEEILEGGKRAFEIRRLKYGF